MSRRRPLSDCLLVVVLLLAATQCTLVALFYGARRTSVEVLVRQVGPAKASRAERDAERGDRSAPGRDDQSVASGAAPGLDGPAPGMHGIVSGVKWNDTSGHRIQVSCPPSPRSATVVVVVVVVFLASPCSLTAVEQDIPSSGLRDIPHSAGLHMPPYTSYFFCLTILLTHPDGSTGRRRRTCRSRVFRRTPGQVIGATVRE